MQRWRFIGYITLALSLWGAPAWLLAQEPAKKDTPSSPAAASAVEKAQQPQGDVAKKAAATIPDAAQPAANAAAAVAAPPPVTVPAAQKEFKFFAFLNDPAYTLVEQISLWVVLLIAVAGLVYAGGLVGQVYGADEGTEIG